MYRVLYLGQKWIGEKCFEILRKNQGPLMQICAVVSNESETVWWGSNAIYRRCKQENIPFVSNASRHNKAIATLIDTLNVNLVLSVQHPWVLPQEVLSKVNYQAYNLHNAKLPEYQGHNCCNHAILNAEKSYTSTIHMISDVVDAGDIIMEKTFELTPVETARGLYEKALIAGELIFQQFIDCLLTGNRLSRKAITAKGTFYPRNSLGSYREIKDITDLQEVDRKSRGLYFPPFEPAYYVLAGKKYYVLPGGFHRFAHEFKSRMILD